MMRSVRVGAPQFAGTLLAVCAGCGSPAPDDAPAGVWGNATAVEELAVGIEFGADEYMFGYIASIAVGADGTMYVSDAQQDIVRMYDADGVFVRDIGRQGQGPGEYGSWPALGVLPDGTLVMRDRSTRRVSFFSPAGDYLDSSPAVPGRDFAVGRGLLVFSFGLCPCLLRGSGCCYGRGGHHLRGLAVGDRDRPDPRRPLGVAVFERTTRTVPVTEAGERLYAKVRPALEEPMGRRRRR